MLSRSAVPRSIFAVASFVFLAAAFLSPSHACAQQPAITAADILSAAFVPELSASPAGRRVAWVANQEGKRNIFVASAPDFAARQLTTTTRDDGQDVTSLTWTSDGRTIYYVRGAAPNRAGENPNPASDPAGAEQAIWRVSVERSTSADWRRERADCLTAWRCVALPARRRYLAAPTRRCRERNSGASLSRP